jgi:hypothetical protein
MPQTWCSRVCRNALSNVCLEACAPARDCSWFEPKGGLSIADVPRFPKHEYNHEMSPKQRQICMGWYVGLLVDQAQGIFDERARGHRDRFLPEPVKVPGVRSIQRPQSVDTSKGASELDPSSEQTKVELE